MAPPSEITKFCSVFESIRNTLTKKQLRAYVSSNDNSGFVRAAVLLLRNTCVKAVIKPPRQLWESLRRYKETIRRLVDPTISVKRKREELAKSLPLVKLIAELVSSFQRQWELKNTF